MGIVKKLPPFLKKHCDTLALLGGLALYCAVTMLLGLPCPIQFVTGVSCPGCGMTRALLSLLRGDLAMATYYHPLVFLLLPFAAVLLLFGWRRMYKARRVTVAVGVALLIAVYLYRVLVMHSPVVTVDIQGGLVLRILSRLF